jgi:hypothetical protein
MFICTLDSETKHKPTSKGESIMKAIRISWLSVSMVVILTVSARTKLQAAPIAGPFVNLSNGHTYYLLENSNWTDAQAQAVTLGGNLATVDDAAENSWIYQTFADYGGIQRNLWIGLNAVGGDGGNPSSYHWVDGSSSAFRNWAAGEPAFVEQFVYIIPSGYAASGQWNNTSDKATNGWDGDPTQIPNYGVAEVDVIPEPSSFVLAGLGAVTLLFRCWMRRR